MVANEKWFSVTCFRCLDILKMMLNSGCVMIHCQPWGVLHYGSQMKNYSLCLILPWTICLTPAISHLINSELFLKQLHCLCTPAEAVHCLNICIKSIIVVMKMIAALTHENLQIWSWNWFSLLKFSICHPVQRKLWVRYSTHTSLAKRLKSQIYPPLQYWSYRSWLRAQHVHSRKPPC